MASADLSVGRTNQKRRTHQAIIDAVNALLERGLKPTLDDVAAEALVSRATIYRYFSSIDELVADALLNRSLASPEELFADVPEGDLLARVLAVEEHLHTLMLSDEVALHTVVRLFANQWLEGEAGGRVPRPGRRLPLIDEALAPFAGQLGTATLGRLRDGLALAIGMEAVVTLRDVLGLDPAAARERAGWAVRALVAQALYEASG